MDLIKISSYQNLSIDNFGYQRSYLYKIKEYEDYFITLPYWGYYKKSNTVVETEVKLCKLIPSDSFGTRATFITLIEDPNRYKKKDLQKNLLRKTP